MSRNKARGDRTEKAHRRSASSTRWIICPSRLTGPFLEGRFSMALEKTLTPEATRREPLQSASTSRPARAHARTARRSSGRWKISCPLTVQYCQSSRMPEGHRYPSAKPRSVPAFDQLESEAGKPPTGMKLTGAVSSDIFRDNSPSNRIITGCPGRRAILLGTRLIARMQSARMHWRSGVTGGGAGQPDPGLPTPSTSERTTERGEPPCRFSEVLRWR